MDKISTQDNLNILNQAIEIANQIVKRLDIPAGSYTAEEVHKAIIHKYGKLHNRGGHDRIFTKAFDDNEKYDIRFSYAHKLQSTEQKMMFPTRDIFKNIAEFEKTAGIKKKDRHVWVKESPHTKVCTTVVDFPAKKTAHGMATIMGGVNKPSIECMVYMPKDSKVVGVCNSEYIYYNHCCKAESEVNLPDVAFKFRAATMKQIFGRCTVDYYIDAKGAYSLVITNEEGWKTGVNARLSEYEMQSVYRMMKVQETDVSIVSGYHSEQYINDAEVKPKMQHQEKSSFDNDTIKEIFSGPDEDLKSVPAVIRNEPAPILEDIIKDVKESEETVPQERQTAADIKDVLEEISNGTEMSKETGHQEKQTATDIKDVLEEISNGSEMSKETVPQERQPVVDIKDVVDEILNDSGMSKETVPQDKQPVVDIKDVVDEIFNDSESVPTVNRNESAANDIPTITVNDAKESVKNLPTDSRKELKVKHPHNRVNVKLSRNKHLFSKTVNRHIKCHKKNKHH